VEAILALEDGRAFRGRAFGAHAERDGEVVFNTAMSGYQEILTDPSYKGQIVVLTCPHIGNYGTNALDHESAVPRVEGLVVRELSGAVSNWRATHDLHQYLAQHGIPGITEIDTRALTRHIREGGAPRGVLSSADRDVESLVRKAGQSTPLGQRDLVSAVTCPAPYVWDRPRDGRWTAGGVGEGPGGRVRCVAIDYGAKTNILRILHETGFDLTVVPAFSTAEEVLAHRPDAVFLSNGPGDPAALDGAVETIRGLLGRIPIFGICLGFQLAARALGGTTFKLKFGHHGANHPVRDLRTGKVEVTSQNHGYAVDPLSLPPAAQVTHINLNDGTCQGFVVADARLMAVQYHPESSPGPHDSMHLFREFRAMVEDGRRTERDRREARGATR
jgi:carbamoyl-phosphate synthase small subunit